MVFLPPWSDAALQPLIAQFSRDFALAPVALWRIDSLEEQCVVFELLDHGQRAEALAARLGTDPRVRSASAVATFATLGAAEPYQDLQSGHATLRVAAAHQHATGRGVRVAVVDTGVDFDHPDLRGRVTTARSFVAGDRGFTGDHHGTAVAGVIAAAANGVGILGVAPDAELLALKACTAGEQPSGPAVCHSDSLALALDFAITAKADVLNLSFGGPHDRALERLLEVALDRGIVVVAADDPTSVAVPFPGSHAGVVLVSGPQSRRRDLVAPAAEVVTTVPGGRYDFVPGTSLAAAATSGVVALVLEVAPDLSPGAVAALLRATAPPCCERGHMVDAGAAVAQAAAARSAQPR
jgi:subtilisin family serine protease